MKLGTVSIAEAPVCTSCSKPVFKYEEHKVLDKTYHRGCFACFHCARLVSLTRFAEGGDQNPYCVACCQRKFGTHRERMDTGYREQEKLPFFDPNAKEKDPWGDDIGW